MLEVLSIMTVCPRSITSLTVGVEASRAGNRVIVDMEVTVVDHIGAVVVISGTVDSPEARI